MKTILLRLLPLALLVAVPFTPASAATVKALSFAITGVSSNTGDKNKIKQYIQDNSIDFGLFDYAKQEQFFINADFPDGIGNFKVARYFVDNTHFWKYVIYDSNKYELVNVPADDKSGSNIAAVFRDANGDEFALLSVRGTYKDDKVDSTIKPVKTYVEAITNKYPAANLILTYNANLSGSYSGRPYADILDTYLTETSSGPHITRLGRTSGGGAYMYQADIPESYSVQAVDSIGTTHDGLLITLTYPTKYKVVFNDWDGTGLQTNIVYAGESVTPPVPVREGYTFTGWDHSASEFEAVTASFTATAQYAENTAWLLISGDPEEIGTADPVYGTISTNGSFTASVTATNLLESGVERWVCTGYTHYEITDVVTGAKTIAQEGNAASFAYEHVFHDELLWHFTNEWLVSISTTAGGSVSAAAETWVRNGETIALVATPEEGYDFWRWDGDTDGIDATAASISPTILAARSLRAVFALSGTDASVQYVSTEGNDENSGYFSNVPKRTVQAAIDTLAEMPGYGTVHVGAGRYVLQNTVFITNAIAVLGATRNPEDVILRAKDVSNQGLIALRINHADAFVANLVVENGHGLQTTSYPYGGNIAIEEKGGTVSNCVIRGGTWGGMYARGVGAWLNSKAAILTHCVITNNNAAGSSKQLTTDVNIYSGLFVHVEKGTVANCLIANNRDIGGMNDVSDGRQAWTCGVTIRDGALLDCTVVTNEARYTGGVYLYPNGYATNVVVAGCVNRCTYPSVVEPAYSDVGFKGTLANASHCASDGGEALDETCVAGTMQTFFRDVTARDYRPRMDSPLVNKGVAYSGLAAIDLLGKARVQDGFPDIGCYENPARGTLIFVK